MNVVGLYIGNPSGFACSQTGVIRSCGSQPFDVGSKSFGIIFARWIQEGGLTAYDHIGLWSPRVIQPSIAPAYKWVASQLGEKLVPITPRELREAIGHPYPTRRDYLKGVRRRYETVRVQRVEEAFAIVIAESVASQKAGGNQRPSVRH